MPTLWCRIGAIYTLDPETKITDATAAGEKEGEAQLFGLTAP